MVGRDTIESLGWGFGQHIGQREKTRTIQIAGGGGGGKGLIGQKIRQTERNRIMDRMGRLGRHRGQREKTRATYRT